MINPCVLIFCFCFLAFCYTVQAQSCNANIPASTPSSYLKDNGNGTITDRQTNLMWKKCVEGLTGNNCEIGSAGEFSWQTALKQPGAVNGTGGFAGYQDWRLPNINELVSIVEEQCLEPAINLFRFPNTPSDAIWSASHVADRWVPEYGNYLYYTWVVSFYSGSVSRYYARSSSNQVRLVRDN